MTRVHLFIHSFVPYDAQSNHMRHIRDLLFEHELLGNTYVWESRGTKRSEVRSYRSFPNDKIDSSDIALYQLGTGSKVAEMLSGQSIPLVVNYHNVTPAEMYEDWEPHVGGELEKGRAQLAQLAPRSSLGIAVSRFNEGEMIEAGYRDTTVVPLFFDVNMLERAADRAVSDQIKQRKENGETVWLFVGRISPNKCQHDLIKAFAFYRQSINPNAHLYLVGGSASNAYQDALNQFVDTAGLNDSVTFTGGVSDEQLTAYYQNSDVFVCMSEHEGFCAPILEAFQNSLPVVAFASSAIPETVGEAALLVTDKTPASVAAVVDRVCSDESLEQQLVDAGKRRLGDFDINQTRSLFMAAMEKVLP